MSYGLVNNLLLQRVLALCSHLRLQLVVAAVGVRKLKDNLSAYLRRVKRGEVVRITDRGEAVAELRPPPQTDADEDVYERLLREGKILAPLKRWSNALVARPPRAPLAGGTASLLISQDREDRS
jgi:antitoxin (DNA-binding transcriptional repressor) of toxin-antitoxin stability system